MPKKDSHFSNLRATWKKSHSERTISKNICLQMVRVHAAALFLEGVQTLGCSFLGSKIKFCNFLTERAESGREISCLEQDYQSPSLQDTCQARQNTFRAGWHITTILPWSLTMVCKQVRKKNLDYEMFCRFFRCLKRWLIWNCCSKASKNCISQISYIKVWWPHIILSSYTWIFKLFGSTVNFYAAVEDEFVFFKPKP